MKWKPLFLLSFSIFYLQTLHVKNLEAKTSASASNQLKNENTEASTSVSEDSEADSFFPRHALYVDGGVGYAMLLEKDDRRYVKDSAWLSGRLGYQLNQNIGLHFELGYSPLSVKTTLPISAYYFYLGPGIKCTIPLQKRLAIFVNGVLGYGRLNVHTTGYSGSGSGVHLGIEMGITYKFNKWMGVSPYLGDPSITNGDASSEWLTLGVLGSFNF